MQRVRAERWELQNELARLLPQKRCADCLRRVIPGASNVTINYSAANKSAHYGGLMTCGSVWLCPLCAAKVTEHRRRELKRGLREARRRGYRVVMFTFTFSHHAHQALNDLLTRLKHAYNAMWSGRPSQRFRGRYGVLGAIESLEVTWGLANGWHPHIHVLLVVRGDVDLTCMESEARGMWEHAAARFGLSMNGHGFKLDDCDAAIASYVIKWGVEPMWDESSEISKWHTKRGVQAANDVIGEEHYTPFGLLRLASEGNVRAGALFVEYAAAFHGRRQLQWSPGLRELLGVGVEKSDKEVAEEQTEQAEVLVVLNHNVWRLVLANDARSELLEIARSGDRDQVWRFLADLGVAVWGDHL